MASLDVVFSEAEYDNTPGGSPPSHCCPQSTDLRPKPRRYAEREQTGYELCWMSIKRVAVGIPFAEKAQCKGGGRGHGERGRQIGDDP